MVRTQKKITLDETRDSVAERAAEYYPVVSVPKPLISLVLRFSTASTGTKPGSQT
jgi:hypothetical protein